MVVNLNSHKGGLLFSFFQEWEGISQQLQLEKLVPHLLYSWVRIANAPTAMVTATLSLGQAPNVRYVSVGKVNALPL